MPGLFIVLEGVECSGKSTQAQMLGDFCRLRGIPHIAVREPGSTPFGEKLRALILGETCVPSAEFLAFSAARAQLTESLIKPALAEGHIVICDRYYHSSMVYQGYARGLDGLALGQITQFAVGGLSPDFAFLIDPGFETAQARLAAKKGRDRIESEGRAFHQKVYEGYTRLCAEDPALLKLDGSPPPRDIHHYILNLLATADPRFHP